MSSFFNFKKSQGEIFGIALLFVVIIIGVLIYSQIKALTPDNDADLDNKYKNELLAQTSLETILKTSSKCNVDGGSGYDSVQELINTCLARAYSNNDVRLECPERGDSFGNIWVCAEAISILNESLYSLFGNESSSLVKYNPFLLEIDLPNDVSSALTSTEITNFGNFSYRGKIINESNYRKYGFKKASSDLKPWATAQRSIKMTLAIYYR